MKKNLLLIIVFIIMLCQLKAQLININPDPNGSPWITGGAIKLSPQELASIPELVIPPVVLANDPPSSAFNHDRDFFPPVEHQDESNACVQFSEIWYIFTYEINRSRGVEAGDIENSVDNLYDAHYTYNFLNGGDKQNGTQLLSGFNIVKESGCPSYFDYHIPNIEDPDMYQYWMTRYTNYRNAMDNSILEYGTITWGDTYSSLDELKHWIATHAEVGSTTGGLAEILVITGQQETNKWEIDGQVPYGPYLNQLFVEAWGTKAIPQEPGHSLTIVGYDDSVPCLDLDGDGNWANIDKDGDGLELSECEIGAFKVVNSWGTSFGNQGFIWIPYSLMDEGLDEQDKAFYCKAKDGYDSGITIRTKVEHPKREIIKYRYGYSDVAGGTLIASNLFTTFNYQGGPYKMRGIYDGPIEVELDYAYFLQTQYEVGRIFFMVVEEDDSDPSENYDGEISGFSIVDHRWDEEFELELEMEEPILLENEETTTVSIDYDLLVPGDNQEISNNKTLTTDMVCRFNPVVKSNSTLTVSTANIDFYNSVLTIEDGSTLNLSGFCNLNGKRGTSRIDIKGDIQIGTYVTFTADEDCELILNFTNLSKTYTVSGSTVTFDGAELRSKSDKLIVNDCLFENFAHIELVAGALDVDGCTFKDSYIRAVPVFTEDRLIEIDNCDFENKTLAKNTISIEDYHNFNIHDNDISYYWGAAISLYNAGGVAGQDVFTIKDNEISCNYGVKSNIKSTGIKVYNSQADIKDGNVISGNDIGISLLDYCTANIIGSPNTDCELLPQKIINSKDYLLQVSRGTFPTNFYQNQLYIDNIVDQYYIYEIAGSMIPTAGVAENNYWGEGVTNPTTYFYMMMFPTYLPVCATVKSTTAPTLYDSAISFVVAGNYQLAEDKFKEIVNDSAETIFKFACLNQLFELQRIHDQDYSGLKTYYNTNTFLQDTNDLGKMADIMVNKCNIELGNYQTAISFFEDIILNSGCTQDSIFAVIDLGHLYLRMSNSRTNPVYECQLPQYNPTSREEYIIERDRLIDLLGGERVIEEDIEDPISNSESIIMDIVMFPNPTSGLINLNFKLDDFHNLGFIINDQSGRKVFTYSSEEYSKGPNSRSFNVSELPNGVYYLTITNNSNPIENRKLVLLR